MELADNSCDKIEDKWKKSHNSAIFLLSCSLQFPLVKTMVSIAYNNVLPWRGCEKLYLNSRTSDVNFIFRSEEIEKIPAHKSILSIISPVFDGMFYGPNKQDGDIEIVDASAEAFKEFLQFFYRSQVKLTAQNISEVLYLGRQYLLDDWQTVVYSSTDLCESALTLDDMCMGYELAILFELDELKTFCEKQIGENATEIFHSNSFLRCQPNLLRHILQLDSLKCDESTVFDGCMAWAKAECVRKQCDENDVQNLRAQLGELFYEIRFSEFEHKDFNHRYCFYDGLFSLKEFRDITMMIDCKDFQPEKFNRSHRLHARNESSELNKNLIIFSRKRIEHKSKIFSFTRTKFISTSKLRLKKISCYLFSEGTEEIEAKIRIHEGCTNSFRGTLVSFVQTSLSPNTSFVQNSSNSNTKRFGEEHDRYTTNISTDIELPMTITVKPGVVYDIDVQLNSSAKHYSYEETEHLENGTIIDFLKLDYKTYSFIGGFHFAE